ncbi:MAG: hypothetical protein ACOYT8_03825 [Candidatus Dependentiae bacterium]
MKRLLVLFCIIQLSTTQALEKPFESSCVINFFVPYKENPLRNSAQIEIPIINKSRAIILPRIYQSDVNALKELFGRLLNPQSEEKEGFDLLGNSCRKSPFDIIALKTLAAYFPRESIISSVKYKGRAVEEKNSLLDKFSNFFAAPKNTLITFYAPDREKDCIHEFDVELPIATRYLELAPIEALHIGFIKARLNELYAMGIHDDIEPLPLHTMHDIAQLQ